MERLTSRLPAKRSTSCLLPSAFCWMKSLNSSGAEARYLSVSSTARSTKGKVDTLVQTLLPSIDESSRDTLTFLLPILLRDGDEHGCIGVVSFGVDLISASPTIWNPKDAKERKEGRSLTSSMILVLEWALCWGGWGAILRISLTTVYRQYLSYNSQSAWEEGGHTVESVNVWPPETRVGTVPLGLSFKKSGLKFSPFSSAWILLPCELAHLSKDDADEFNITFLDSCLWNSKFGDISPTRSEELV